MQGEEKIAQGQQEARTRWGTQKSGEAFDRKKRSCLSQQERLFVARQTMCVLAGRDVHQQPCGLLMGGRPGFVETSDERTCVLPVPQRFAGTGVIQGLQNALHEGARPQIALCFTRHETRQRLCIQGSVEMLSLLSAEFLWLRLSVRQAFFHCPRYIRTSVPGLHHAGERTWPQEEGQPEDRLTAGTQAFVARQQLCYLCTTDRAGRCAVNHRGGPPGFLVTLVPDRLTPGGMILLPDYQGNGAFEALGNILETRQAALLVPGYADGLALCISGEAVVLEAAQLPLFLREQCRGARRVVALAVQHVERQDCAWSATADAVPALEAQTCR
jgi:hypothetical protein